MITEKTFCEILELVQKQEQREQEFTGDMEKYFDGHLILEISNDIMEAFIKLFSNILEGGVEKDSWIEWHIYENDFGKNKYTVWIEDKEYTITSNKDLYEFLKDWRYYLTK